MAWSQPVSNGMEPEIQLAVKRVKRLRPINEPGLSWLLIVLMLFLMALAISVLGKRGGADTVAIITPGSETISPSETQVARIYTISYSSGVFSPTNLRIHAGDTVRFKNDAFFPIHIASDPDQNNLPGFDSIGDIPQGSYFSFTFAAKGIFGYYNENSPSQKGSIIVR